MQGLGLALTNLDTALDGLTDLEDAGFELDIGGAASGSIKTADDSGLQDMVEGLVPVAGSFVLVTGEVFGNSTFGLISGAATSDFPIRRSSVFCVWIALSGVSRCPILSPVLLSFDSDAIIVRGLSPC